MQKVIKIDEQSVGIDHRPMVVAELSGNHNGQLEQALRLIELAHASGADAIKFQTYTPDTMTIRADQADFKIEGGLWDGYELYDLYQWAHTPWEWHEPMFQKAKALGLLAFSTPFDETAVEFLEQFDPPAYKIASFEMTDLGLVETAALTGKPLIVSTGMAELAEIEALVETVKATGNDQLILLHCVSAYPAKAKDYNLAMMCDMAQRFDVLTGLSDHSLENINAISSVALGASLIEKHFTEHRDEPGPDAAFSLEPEELRTLCRDVALAHEGLGQVRYGPKACEQASLGFRRSLYVTEDIEPGETLSADNIRKIRPGFGLPAKHFSEVLGRKAACRLTKGTPLAWECLE